MITVLWVLTMFIAILAESTAAVNAQAERAPNKFDLDLGKYLWRQIAVLMGWRLNTGVSELDPDDLHLTVGSLLDRVDGQLTRALQGRHAYSSARRRTTWSSVPATRPADVAERYRKMALRSGLTGLDEVSDPPVAPNALPNIVVPPVPARLPASSQRKANGAKGAATNPKTPKTPTPTTAPVKAPRSNRTSILRAAAAHGPANRVHGTHGVTPPPAVPSTTLNVPGSAMLASARRPSVVDGADALLEEAVALGLGSDAFANTNVLPRMHACLTNALPGLGDEAGESVTSENARSSSSSSSVVERKKRTKGSTRTTGTTGHKGHKGHKGKRRKRRGTDASTGVGG